MKPETKLPLDARVYPAESLSERHSSIERIAEDIKAAAHLGIPFTIKTTHRQAFRSGGNVNKADIYEYYVKIGELTDRGEKA